MDGSLSVTVFSNLYHNWLRNIYSDGNTNGKIKHYRFIKELTVELILKSDIYYPNFVSYNGRWIYL